MLSFACFIKEAKPKSRKTLKRRAHRFIGKRKAGRFASDWRQIKRHFHPRRFFESRTAGRIEF